MSKASGDAPRNTKPTAHRVLLAEVGSVEEVVSRLLEGGQHQHALLHLGQAKPSNAQDFALCHGTACQTGTRVTDESSTPNHVHTTE